MFYRIFVFFSPHFIRRQKKVVYLVQKVWSVISSNTMTTVMQADMLPNVRRQETVHHLQVAPRRYKCLWAWQEGPVLLNIHFLFERR